MIGRSLIVATLIGAGLGSALWFWWPTAPPPRTFILEPQPRAARLQEHAVLVSAEQTTVHAGISGSITTMVRAGTMVAVGDELGSQDTESIQQRVEELIAERDTRLSAIEQNRRERALTRSEIANEEAVNEAELAYQRLRIATRTGGPDRITARLQAIERALAALDLAQAEEDLARTRRLVERGLQSVSRLEEAERSHAIHATTAAELAIQHAILDAGPSTIELRELEADRDRALGRVDRAQLARERRLQRIQHDATILQAELEKTEAALAQTREDLANGTLVAPAAGIAMPRQYRDWRSGGRMVAMAPGIHRYSGDALVDIYHPGALEAVIMVNEVDFSHLQTGMPVALSLHAYPDQTFAGTIAFLAGIGRDRGDIDINTEERPNTGVRVFSATIDFSAPVELRPGMTGVVTIDLPSRPAILVIPDDYRDGDSEASWVWRIDGQETERVAVTGLPYGRSGYQILSGLRIGDHLIHPQDRPGRERP